MKATRTWGQITGRSVTPRISEWISRLVDERGGDDRVAAMIEKLAPTVPPEKLLGAVADALVRADLAHQPAPHELSRVELLAWVRDDRCPGEFPVTYDLGRLGLTHDETIEAEAWAARGRRPLPVVAAA